MNRHYTLYAWHLSYFAGKLRAYFIYKKVPFNEIPVSYYMLTGPVQRNTGARVMPLKQARPLEVHSWSPRTTKKLVELQLETKPWVSSISASSAPA